MKVEIRRLRAAFVLVKPPNPTGSNGSKRRGRNYSHRYFAEMLVLWPQRTEGST